MNEQKLYSNEYLKAVRARKEQQKAAKRAQKQRSAMNYGEVQHTFETYSQARPLDLRGFKI